MTTSTATTGQTDESEGLSDDLASAAQRVVDLLRSAGPSATTMAVPGTDWSVGETAAHVATLWSRVLGDPRRSASAAEMAALNETCLSEYTERDLGAIAEQLAADVAAGITLLKAVSLDHEVHFHAGQTITIRSAFAVLVLEHVLHGRDIADAIGATLPVDQAAVGRALRGIAGPVAGWLRSDAPDAELILNLDDGGAPMVLRVESGVLSFPTSPSAAARASAPLPPLDVARALSRRGITGDPVADALPTLFEPI